MRVSPNGLDLGEETVLPLRAGAMHYWRHPPDTWAQGLDALKSLGLTLVDVYVPWGVHEIAPGLFDFGEKKRQLDVVRFLMLVHERGLKAIARPGPHINAELTYFGLPERIVWDRDCQARTPRDHPVMLPVPPLAFPVPSYASEAFHDEAALWFEAVAHSLAPLRHPDGPIVMVQVDNEGALFFRDGPYDQDYHPDAIRLFRTFLRAKYRSSRELGEAWGEARATFAQVEPPRRFDAKSVDELVRHLDWMEFHEHLVTHALSRFSKALSAAGMKGIPTTHNFPLGEAATPLNAGQISDVVDLVGLDYYHHASPGEHIVLLRRTTELVSRCEGLRVVPYGAEVGVGFPPFFAPIDERDSIYTLLAALAYGLRGFNLYMAVERDRWIGSPIDAQGRRRPLADRIEALCAVLERTRFHELRRRAPVCLVMPRSVRRLARARHAFGPLTPALFNVLGAGFRESVLEGDLADEEGALAAEVYIRTFERALSVRGVPFRYAGGDSLEPSISGAAWIVCATASGVKKTVLSALRAAAKEGALVTVGPHLPERDGSMRRLKTPHDARGLELEPLEDAARADALVARRIEELGLPTYPVQPHDAYVCLHEDASGAAKVVFVMNPAESQLVVRVSLGGASLLEDLLPGEGQTADIASSGGSFEVPLAGRSVRMFAIQ